MDVVIIAEIIGWVATGFGFTSYMSKDLNRMRILGSIALFLFTISTYLNGATNGAVVSAFGFSVRVLSIYISISWVLALRILTIIAAAAFFALFNSEGIYGILPSIGLIMATIGDTQTDILKTKFIYLGNLGAWLIYTIYLESPSAIAYEVLGLSALLYTITQIKKERKN